MKNLLLKIFLLGLPASIYAQGTMLGNSANADVSIYSNNLVRITVKNTGLTGIGTNAPTELLDVNGTARLRTVTQNDTYTRVLVTDTNGKVFWRTSTTLADNLGNHTATQSITPNANNTLDLGSTTNAFRNLYLGGRIGIGTTSPTELLDVNGTARLRVVTQDNTQSRLLVSDVNGKVFWRDIVSVGLPFVMTSPPFNNLGVGTNVLASNTGSLNNAFGYSSMQYNTTGGSNAAYGSYSMWNNTEGEGNSAFGYFAMWQNITGDNNSAFGGNSLQGNSSGNYNSGFGFSSLAAVQTGSYNASLGYNAGPNSDLSNSTAIGANAIVSVDYGIVLGTSLSLVGIRQNSPAYPLHVQNAYCDGNTWFNASDENLKENFRTLADESILDQVLQLKIQRWNYKGENSGISHIGPTSQNFNAVFHLGGDNKTIASVDEAGIALAAIQELARKTEMLEKLVKNQQQLIASLLTTKSQNYQPETSIPETGLKLYQNHPNPFQDDTKIEMEIPQDVSQAVLYIYDLQGKGLEEHVIIERGKTSIMIEGGKFPSGVYLYTLVADSQAAGVKRMILTE